MSLRPSARSGARFYCPQPLASGVQLALPERIAHHAVRVLRLKPGDAIVLFNGEGGEYDATLLRNDKRESVAEVGAWHDVERESPLRLTLAQGISAAEKMDYTVQKAVELGAAAIQPLETTKSIVRLDAERAQRRLVHWRQIVVSACEQCGRNHVPAVAPVADLRTWLGMQRDGIRVLLSPRSAQRIADLPRGAGSLILLAGPEGGLAEDEEAAARVAGFQAVCLGPRILRTETAALAAMAVLQSQWGDV